MRISIVIPVYNEASHLAACLDAISLQTKKPYEVIVVDNNSTDDTVDIAQQYSFVTVIRERRQGVVFARDRGFNAAKGDIIGRIDADTLVSPNWVATLQTLFTERRRPVDAVSGAITYYDLPWQEKVGNLDLTIRQWIADGMGREVFLYGANMAIRRSAWLKIRSSVCRQGGRHEDFDLAIHLHAKHYAVYFDRRLQAAVSLRRCNVTFRQFIPYAWLNPLTYILHGRSAQRRMYPVVGAVVLGYPLIKLLYRLYDPTTETVSIYNLSNKRSDLRVNPATYVD